MIELYKGLDELVTALKKKDKEFRDAINSSQSDMLMLSTYKNSDGCVYAYYKNKDKCVDVYTYLNISKKVPPRSIGVTSIFNYGGVTEAYAYLDAVYAEDDEDVVDIRVYEVDSKDYPKKDEVLVRKGKGLVWSKSLQVPLEISKKLSKVTSRVRGSISRIYLVNEVPYYSLYNNSSSSKIKIHPEDDEVLVDIINWVASLAFPVKEVYWFPSCSLGRARARKNSDGEYTLVVY